MLSSLILTAFLMGLGGAPHCAAMCGAACAALLPGGVSWLSLLGRCVGYAVLGAVAAASFGTVAQWGRQVAFLQPLWILALALAVLLGLWLLWTGAMPRQLDALGQDLYRGLKARLSHMPAFGEQGALKATWPFVAGMAWALLPCGLLYAALMVAALAPHAAGGALVMVAFALPSSLGVWGAPFVLKRLSRFGTDLRARSGEPAIRAAPLNGAGVAIVPVLWLKTAQPSAGDRALSNMLLNDGAPAALSGRLVDPRWAVRLSGLMLAGMSAWALSHQIMDQWRAWCS